MLGSIDSLVDSALNPRTRSPWRLVRGGREFATQSSPNLCYGGWRPPMDGTHRRPL